MTDNIGYGRERLRHIVEKEAEEEAKEQQQNDDDDDDDDDDEYDTVPKKKLVYEGTRLKEFGVTGNLNNANTRMIMTNITPHIEMRTKVIYSFKSEIHRGAGEIVDYSKTLTTPPGMFTGLEGIQ